MSSEKVVSASKSPKFSRELKALGITVVFMLLAYLVFGIPYYETCDDILLTSIVSGVGFVDQPDPHILYSNFLIGITLSKLYENWPNIQWYGFYLVSSELLSIVIITAVIQRKFTTRMAIVPTILFLLTCIRPILLVQFTTAACLIATAASSLLLYAFEHYKLKSLVLKFSIFSAFLYIWSSMVRIESAILVMGLTALILFLKQLQSFRITQVKYAFFTFAGAIAVISSLYLANNSFYENSKWNYTYDQIKASWSLINTTRLHNQDKATREALKEYSWTVEDTYMLRSWYLLDPKYSNQNLQDLNQKVNRLNNELTIWTLLEAVWDVITDRTVAPNILVLVVFLILLIQARFSARAATIYLFAILSIMLLLVSFSKFPPRVMAGMLQLSAVAFLLYSSPYEMSRLISSKKNLLLSMLVVTVFLAPSFYNFYSLAKEASSNRIEIKAFTNELRKSPDNLYVLWGAYFPYKYISPFDNLKDYFGGLKLLGFNSLMPSPIFQQRLKEFKISDFLSELDNKKVTFLIEPYTQTILESYLAKSIGKVPKFDSIFENSKLKLIASKAHYVNKGDTTEPVNFSSGKSLVFYPAKGYLTKATQLELVEQEPSRTIYSTKGKLPIIITNFEDAPLKANEFSHVLAELKFDNSSGTIGRMCFGIETNKKVDNMCYVRLKEDAEKHIYSFDLNKLFFKPEDKITNIFFYPMLEYNVKKNQLLEVGKIGLIRKDSK